MRHAAFLVMSAVLISTLRADAAEDYQQRQGGATVRIQGAAVDAGKLHLKLADSATVVIKVEGEYPLRFEKNDDSLLHDQLKAFRMSGAWRLCEGETVRTRVGDREQWQQVYFLDPLQPGQYELPLKTLSYSEGTRKQAHEAKWKPIEITITSEIVQPDLKELRDIPGPEAVPPAPRSWLPWTIGVGLLLFGGGLLVGGWELIRRRAKPTHRLTPSQWAFAEIERMEKHALSADGPGDSFLTQLSDVLRHYFELRFHFPASRQTTPEFLRTAATSNHLGEQQQNQLRDFLERCDLGKFARVEFAREEYLGLASLARDIVSDRNA